MSSETSQTTAGRRRFVSSLSASVEGGPSRVLALVSAMVLVGSFLTVPLYVTDVVGGTYWLTLYALGTFLVATIVALGLPDGIDLPVGIAIGAGFLLAGLGGYLLLIPDVYYALFSLQRVLIDTAALLAGQSVLLLLDADLWAIGIVPAPLFLTWFFALRRRYELAAIVGGVTLGFFTLTGDTSSTVTVIGMTAALATIGFGSVDRWNGTLDQLQDVGLVLVAAVIATRFIEFVPNGGGSATDVVGEDATLEGTLVGSPGQVPVVGSITLSPAVRFVVEAERGSYWRVASYDRYTGQGWVSTAEDRAYSGTLQGPPGESDELVQEYELKAPSQAMPAAWKPVFVDDSAAEDTIVAGDGSIRPTNILEEGDTYRVVSRTPNHTAADLRESEKAYPDSVRETYLQLPDSTSSRLEDRAREIAEDVDSPYLAATNIRDWLQREKSYSLDVPRPGTDVADRFVFDMESGYCVYFATALTVMLRSIGVPARFVVGYSTGERLGENRFRVRGLHSHAWTEVFFPETGWITLDPTPSDPRRAARTERIESGGGGGGGGSGSGGNGEPTGTPIPTASGPIEGAESGVINSSRPNNVETIPEEVRRMQEGETPPPPGNVSQPAVNSTSPVVESNGGDDDSGGGGTGRRADAGDRLTLLAGAAGLALGAYRFGAVERFYRSVWIRRQTRTGDPREDTKRAYERLEYLLADEHRPRREDETPRAYLRSLGAERGVILDDRVYRVLGLYEKVRYSDDPRSEDAREAIRLVDELLDEQ